MLFRFRKPSATSYVRKNRDPEYLAFLYAKKYFATRVVAVDIS